MWRDGLEPVQPHYPKIYSLGRILLFDVLLKISQLKMEFALLRISV